MSTTYTLGTEARFDVWYGVDRETADSLYETFRMSLYAPGFALGERAGCYATLLLIEGEVSFYVWAPETPLTEIDAWVRDIADPAYVQHHTRGVMLDTSR